MVERVLSVFDLLRGALRLAGVDYPKFRAILAVKLRLDTLRRHPVLKLGKASKTRNHLLRTCGMYVFYGLFGAVAMFMAKSPLVAMTILDSYILVLMAMALIADFSSVLLDTTDHQVLGPRPVSPRTVFMARLAHVAIYLSLLTFSLSLFSLLFGTWKIGWWFAPVFALTMAAGVVTVLAAVSVLYLAIMRFFNEEKVRDVILWVQVAMAVGVVGAYQVLPRLIDFSILRDLDISRQAWIYVYPPTWFAAPVDLVAGTVGTPQIVLTFLALAAPLLGLALVAALAPRFRAAPEPDARSRRAEASSRGFLARRLSRWVTRSAEERAGFELAWHLSARDRRFKLRVYPNIAFVFIFGFIFLFSSPASLGETWSGLADTQKHLLFLYLGLMMVPVLLAGMPYTDRPDAAWIYRSLPFRHPGRVLLGNVRAFYFRFTAPAFLLMSVVILAIWGAGALFDVILAFSLAWCMTVLFALVQERAFPFSLQATTHQVSGNQARYLALGMIPILLGLGHWGLTFVPGGVALAIASVLAIGRALSRAYSRTQWEDVAFEG